MSLTIASFNEDDVVTDPEAVIKSVNSSCLHRDAHKLVQAVCGVGGGVYFILRPDSAGGDGRQYHLIQLSDLTRDGFVATVNSHHQGSVDIVGTFSAHGTTFAVFRDGISTR